MLDEGSTTLKPLYESRRFAELERRANKIGFDLFVEKETVVMRYYNLRYESRIGNIVLSELYDVNRWLDILEKHIAWYEKSKWGQYPGWDQELPDKYKNLK
jgi:hypothetical protein